MEKKLDHVHKKLLNHQEITHISKKEYNPWRITLVYTIIGVLWILFSDGILGMLVQDHQVYQEMQLYKGWFYVAMTSILFYYFASLNNNRVFQLNQKIQDKNEELLATSEELIAIDDELVEKVKSLDKMNLELQKQKKYFDLLYNNSNAAIMIWRTTGEVVDLNKHYYEVLGYDESFVGENWIEYTRTSIEDFDLSTFIDRLYKKKQLINYETRMRAKDGSVRDMIWNDVLMETKNEEPLIVSFGIDVTDEHKQQQKLIEMATKDPVTGLDNRVVFDTKIEALIEEQKPYTVYYINIDYFKDLNDIHGHDYGDLFLVALSKTLKFLELSHAYRWQGDGFLIIQETVDEEKIQKMLEYILNLSNRKWELVDVEYQMTLSVGVVTSLMSQKNVSEVLKQLDIALYKAKANGRGRYEFYSQELLEEVFFRAGLEKKINNALLENAFELYYQPIFNLRERTFNACEVLLRWQDTTHKDMNIGRLIEFAEQTGQILRIDRWVIEKAFLRISAEHEIFSNLNVSINISTQTFNSSKFIPYLVEMVDLYKINTKRISFEITEHSIIKNMTKAKEVMSQLKAIGFSVSLDDFGTRYSSLNYLSMFPFDVLKIDKSYIDDILDKDKGYIIVKQLLSLTEALGIVTVAEGIEHEAQSVLLHDMGCQFGQGYHFAKPMPYSELEKQIALKE
ncbi:sensor domain-containing protein [Petrocella sp. FN5]|uniref:sensor domain-containing protein n=1 Tax=Petrocella sp. FN5 TaxID=3032002 RepID=UPI0023DC891A|nr:EAL domain-containing protein [Petrocella sp. FN5]MDF1617160.1 EAL domain-containing protein [Petrocella sp. FN5]